MLSGRLLQRHASTAEAISIAALAKQTETSRAAKVQGWVSQAQRRGDHVFCKLKDGSEYIQLVMKKENGKEVKVGTSLKATGTWQKSLGAEQQMELHVEELSVTSGDPDPRYDTLSLDHLRSQLHLRTRANSFVAMFRLRSAVFQRTHQFFMSREFIHVDPPMLTKNDCEGGGEVFSVTSANGEPPVFLTVSSQLHLEAMCSRLSNVYTLGPAFRAEKQQSHAHMSEFRMLEAEITFVTELDQLTKFVEDYVKDIIDFCKKKKERKLLGPLDSKEVDLDVFNETWKRLRYSEAVEFLKGKNMKLGPNGGLTKQNELALVDHYGPLFVTHFPKEQKPFYMKRSACGLYTESFDLLFPMVGELAGGSLRENDPEQLKMRGDVAKWYLECRERGQPPTAGFGVGFDRLLQVLFSVKNIKDTIPFPRWYKKCQC